MGLARIDQSEANEAMEMIDLTNTGQVMGTVDYMAPEQAANTRKADARADIYALGCTLYHILTGRSPYSGDTVIERILAHRDQPIPSLRDARASVPAELDAVYQKMMAKNPADRQQTMGEVVEELEAAVAVGVLSDGAMSATTFLPAIGETSLSASEVDASSLQVGEQTLDFDKGKERAAKKSPIGWIAGAGAAAALLATGILLFPSLFNGSDEVAEKPPVEPESPREAPVVPVTNLEQGTDDSPGDSTGSRKPWTELLPAYAPPPAIGPFKADEAKQHQQAWADFLGLPVEKDIVIGKDEEGKDVTLTMVLIPPGEFMMGSSEEERIELLDEAKQANDEWATRRIPSEGPQHLVRITSAFYLGKFEMTQLHWEQVFGRNLAQFKKGPKFPIEMISWDDVQTFLTKLNTRMSSGKIRFVLPTESQWEYACRAGTSSRWYSGNSEMDLPMVGWFEVNSDNSPHAVGELRPNAFGLYDMYGNVSEWCADLYGEDYYDNSPLDNPTGPPEGTHRVVRGGHWGDSVEESRSARRAADAPNGRDSSRGFRLAASIKMPKAEGGGSEATASPVDFQD